MHVSLNESNVDLDDPVITTTKRDGCVYARVSRGTLPDAAALIKHRSFMHVEEYPST